MRGQGIRRGSAPVLLPAFRSRTMGENRGPQYCTEHRDRDRERQRQRERREVGVIIPRRGGCSAIPPTLLITADINNVGFINFTY